MEPLADLAVKEWAVLGFSTFGLLQLAVTFAAALAAGQSTPRFRFEPQPRTAAELAKRFTPAQIDVLEMLNRRDRAHLIRVNPAVPGLIVPVTWTDEPLAYSPFPAEWPAVASSPKFPRRPPAAAGLCRVRVRQARSLGSGQYRPERDAHT